MVRRGRLELVTLEAPRTRAHFPIVIMITSNRVRVQRAVIMVVHGYCQRRDPGVRVRWRLCR